MFDPHVIVPGRRRCRKPPTRRQRLAAVLSGSIGACVSAGVGLAFASQGSGADTTVLWGVVVGLAFVAGIVLAKMIGGRSSV